MQFDHFSIVLLTLRRDAPELVEADADTLQDAHMSYLSDLQAKGLLLAAGPLLDEHYRGLVIMSVTADEAGELLAKDPAVRAGRFDTVSLDWLSPEGVVTFGDGLLPRSMSELG